MKLLQILVMMILCGFLVPESMCFAQDVERLNSMWAEDSRWKGIIRQRSTDGSEMTFDAELRIAKRNGNKFEGTWIVLDGRGELEVKGTVKGTKVAFQVTKILKRVDPNNDRKPDNLLGVSASGQIRRKAKTNETVVDLTYNWAAAENATIARRGIGTLVLDE